jgi:hypothetical protein
VCHRSEVSWNKKENLLFNKHPFTHEIACDLFTSDAGWIISDSATARKLGT